MSIRIKVLIITGIIGIAMVSGTLQALASPRKSVEKEGEQEQGKGEKS
jgi:hypothetical protein